MKFLKFIFISFLVLTSIYVLGHYVSNDEKHVITRITTRSEICWKADYSDYEDSWVENLSDVYYVETEFSKLGFFNIRSHPNKPINNKFYPEQMPVMGDATWADAVWLDSSIIVKCWYDVTDKTERYAYVEFSEYDNYKAICNSGDTVLVRYWYWFPYSVEKIGR